MKSHSAFLYRCGVLAAATTAIVATAAVAQDPSTNSGQAYPNRPIRMLVPVPAGGTPDVVARMLRPGLSAHFGQQIVVDNRGGVGIGAELAARAAPDGYTIFFTSPGPITILPHLQKEIAYAPLKDFAPVTLVASGPYLLITHPSVPAKTVKELLALAKTEPGKLNYASAGNGTGNHLAMEVFKSMAGVNITHVPYKGAPQAIIDLMSGSINLMFNSIPPVIQHIKAGRLRVLGISSAKRSPQLPDVPSVAEAGVPGYDVINWFGLLVPAATPKPIVTRLHEAVVKVLNTPEVRSQLETQGYDAVGNSPAEFGKFIREESDRYAKVVKSSGAKVD
ncbi:MAG: Bug family tripartite tricarboxylate transporter substrate binding protein [Burkholderiales bacterium]